MGVDDRHVVDWDLDWWGSGGCGRGWGTVGHSVKVCRCLASAGLLSKGLLRIFGIVHGCDVVVLEGGSWCMMGVRGMG
jgi:hypothetical protein